MECKEVKNQNDKQYHIQCGEGDVGRYVFLSGDPFRTDTIARFLKNPILVAHNREHKTWTGTLEGVPVSVTSTGMGGPSAAIAVEELIHCGADTFIRIGTCGRVCKDSMKESLLGVIVTGSVRDEGTTLQYIPAEYPAIADRHIVAALSLTAAEKGYDFIEGIAHSKDSFYGQHDPNGMPIATRLLERWEAWKGGNVMASEMETAVLFVVSQIRQCRAGAILAYEEMNQETILVAIDGMKRIIQKDILEGRI